MNIFEKHEMFEMEVLEKLKNATTHQLARIDGFFTDGIISV